ncbi:MAG: PD-(D/E)XK nuclease family protein [Chlamydiae bacterium]|nr:PD-(D/E)XK nuclease family protein [Chlamydiota bacterium]MBI3266572.1 PD-(D/E)XK nuclease family protein [Chlamydiota bacterium]
MSKIISRQLKLKLGKQRLDLLVAHGKELCLIELKVTRFSNEYISQVSDYRDELTKLQMQGERVDGRLRVFLLVTGLSNEDKKLCNLHNIEIIEYKPIDVLKQYFQDLSTVAPFLKIKPNDYGVFNIGLINRVLNQLSLGNSNEETLSSMTDLSSVRSILYQYSLWNLFYG